MTRVGSHSRNQRFKILAGCQHLERREYMRLVFGVYGGQKSSVFLQAATSSGKIGKCWEAASRMQAARRGDSASSAAKAEHVQETSGDDVQAGIHVDRVAGHARGRTAHQERHHAADFRDLHQPMRRSPAYGISISSSNCAIPLAARVFSGPGDTANARMFLGASSFAM